jgi:hypothetical protein
MMAENDTPANPPIPDVPPELRRKREAEAVRVAGAFSRAAHAWAAKYRRRKSEDLNDG